MFCLVVLYTFVWHFSCFSSVQPFMVQTSQNFQQAFASLNTDFISIYFSSFFSFAGYFGLLPSLMPNLKRDIQILAFFCCCSSSSSVLFVSFSKNLFVGIVVLQFSQYCLLDLCYKKSCIFSKRNLFLFTPNFRSILDLSYHK